MYEAEVLGGDNHSLGVCSIMPTMNFHPGAMGLLPRNVKGPCVAGIDQRYGNWDVAVLDACRVSPDLVVPRLVFYGKVQDHETIHSLMLAYRTCHAVGDCRPEAGDMIRLQRLAERSRITFWRAQYNTTMSNVPIVPNRKEMLLTLERTMTLDEVARHISTTEMALPQNFADICGGDFARETCASSRMPVIRNGQHWNTWTEGNLADHAFHAMNYALVAYGLARLDKRTDGSVLMPEKGLVKRLADEEDDEDDAGAEVPLWGECGRRNGVVLDG